MNLENSILKILQGNLPLLVDNFISLDELKDRIQRENDSSLFILKLLECLHQLERRDMIETFTHIETKVFCVRLTAKGQNAIVKQKLNHING